MQYFCTQDADGRELPMRYAAQHKTREFSRTCKSRAEKEYSIISQEIICLQEILE